VVRKLLSVKLVSFFKHTLGPQRHWNKVRMSENEKIAQAIHWIVYRELLEANLYSNISIADMKKASEKCGQIVLELIDKK